MEIIVWHLQIQSPPFCDVAKPCNASQARRVTWCNALSHDIWNILWQTNLYFLFLLKPHQTATTAYFLKSREFWANSEDRQINHSIRLQPQIITFRSEKVGRKPMTILGLILSSNKTWQGDLSLVFFPKDFTITMTHKMLTDSVKCLLCPIFSCIIHPHAQHIKIFLCISESWPGNFISPKF